MPASAMCGFFWMEREGAKLAGEVGSVGSGVHVFGGDLPVPLFVWLTQKRNRLSGLLGHGVGKVACF